MTMAGRKLSWDWYEGVVPENVALDETAYIETAFSFTLFRSKQAEGARIGRGASTYGGTMFDVGPAGKVSVGEFAMLNGAWVICEERVEIGDHALISWNVVLMDSYRLPRDVEARRAELERVARREPRRIESQAEARPVVIGANVWIGFDSCILPGVTIGQGSIVGARSVVYEDVPPMCVVAGNPARVIRKLTEEPT